MYLLLSGEGPTDMGRCNAAIAQCGGGDFVAGPMAIVVDKLVEQAQGYELSHLDSGLVEFVSERYLAEGAADLKALKKSPSLAGKKKPKETLYFYRNARVLARRAKEKMEEINGSVIAVLFRDADGTASAERGHREHKVASMLRGFQDEKYEYGVPMMPMPKSEAWLLCAVAKDYQHCAALENESGNDDVANSLKTQLAEALDGNDSAPSVVGMLRAGDIDVHRINMPSYREFKVRLSEVVRNIAGGAPT